MSVEDSMSAVSGSDPLTVLDPHVAGPLDDLVAALGQSGLAPDLLELCGARIEQIIGVKDAVPAREPEGRQEEAVMAFVEQYVVDAHGVTDEMCTELNAVLSPPELAALTTAIATLEGLARSRTVLKGVVT